MTVTKEQAQMLTTLAIACRPHRAPTWDEAGVMAQLAKMRDWSLAEVMLRVAVCADDREAKTPAVISAPGTRIPELKAGRFEPDTWEPDLICSTCSKPEARCRSIRFADDDHTFVSRAHARRQSDRPAEAVARIVGDLHERVTTDPPPRPEPEAGTETAVPNEAALSEED